MVCESRCRVAGRVAHSVPNTRPRQLPEANSPAGGQLPRISFATCSATCSAACSCMFGSTCEYGVERDTDVGVAEPLADDLRRHARGQRCRRVRVADIVQPDRRQPGRLGMTGEVRAKVLGLIPVPSSWTTTRPVSVQYSRSRDAPRAGVGAAASALPQSLRRGPPTAGPWHRSRTLGRRQLRRVLRPRRPPPRQAAEQGHPASVPVWNGGISSTVPAGARRQPERGRFRLGGGARCSLPTGSPALRRRHVSLASGADTGYVSVTCCPGRQGAVDGRS